MIELSGHAKKLTLVSFNPVYQNVLATVSYDGQIRVWDLESAECKHKYQAPEGAGLCGTL